MSATISNGVTIPPGYKVRRVQASDYNNNYLETLKALTVVGDVTETQFVDTVALWESQPQIYHNMVITDEDGKVAAAGNIVIEQKMIHHCGRVGHIEDIAVHQSQQGKQLGKALILLLLEIAKQEKCYKVILDCDPKNVGFYEKCGLKQCGIEMSIRYDRN